MPTSLLFLLPAAAADAAARRQSSVCISVHVQSCENRDARVQPKSGVCFHRPPVTHQSVVITGLKFRHRSA